MPAARRIERSKVEDYLLHPINGRGKATYFEAFGFSRADWIKLHDALLEHAMSNRVTEAIVSIYGTRYVVRGPMGTPDRRDPPPVVCSVWQADRDDAGVRLVTAYPDRRLQER